MRIACGCVSTVSAVSASKRRHALRYYAPEGVQDDVEGMSGRGGVGYTLCERVRRSRIVSTMKRASPSMGELSAVVA